MPISVRKDLFTKWVIIPLFAISDLQRAKICKLKTQVGIRWLLNKFCLSKKSFLIGGNTESLIDILRWDQIWGNKSETVFPKGAKKLNCSEFFALCLFLTCADRKFWALAATTCKQEIKRSSKQLNPTNQNRPEVLIDSAPATHKVGDNNGFTHP